MTQAGLKEDNATNGNMEKEANQLYRRPQMTGQARPRDEEEEVAKLCRPGVVNQYICIS